MKLRNKKTGDIGWLYCDYISVPKKMTVFSEDKDLSAHHWDYNSLTELNAEWEDYEEYGTTFFINAWGRTDSIINIEDEDLAELGAIGNYFETKEEAEKAVKKLKAWKRLKDKGFRFETFNFDRQMVTNGRVNLMIKATFNEEYGDDAVKLSDLDLLFGGEE